MGVRAEGRLSIPQTLAGKRRPLPFEFLLCAHAQARGYGPAAPLFWVSENFPTPRIPGPQHPKRPPSSSLLTTSQLRNPSELLSSLCLNSPPQDGKLTTLQGSPFSQTARLVRKPFLKLKPSFLRQTQIHPAPLLPAPTSGETGH